MGLKGLNNTELVRLSDTLAALERDTIFEMGLRSISGGFATATVASFDNRKVNVSLRYGVQTDCENNIYTETVEIDRKKELGM